jgi:hypothetical protein
MYGLPDSAIVGTIKRFNRRKGRSRNVSEIDPMNFWVMVYAIKRMGARRKAQKARAEFYKKHGFYKQ